MLLQWSLHKWQYHGFWVPLPYKRKRVVFMSVLVVFTVACLWVRQKKNLNPESFLCKLWLLNCQQELQTKSLLPQVRKKSGRNKFLQCQGIYLESGKKWNFELIGGHSSCCDPFHNERWWHSFLLEFDVRFSTLQAHAIKFCGSIPCFLHQCPLLLTPFLLHL